jgi:hypothetical protein
VGATAGRAAVQQMNRYVDQGRITFLRVGPSHGPSGDLIDAGVVVKVDDPGSPGEAYGFQLRDDERGRAHQGMLDLLRDAFNHDWTVRVGYDLESGNANGLVHTVELVEG